MSEILKIIKQSLIYLIAINVIALTLAFYALYNSKNEYQISYTINSSDIKLNLSILYQSIFDDYGYVYADNYKTAGFSELIVDRQKKIDDYVKDALTLVFSNKENWKIDKYDKSFYELIYSSSTLNLKSKKIITDNISIISNDFYEANKYMDDLNEKLKIILSKNIKDTFTKVFINKKYFIKQYAESVYKNNIEKIKTNFLEIDSYVEIFDVNEKISSNKNADTNNYMYSYNQEKLVDFDLVNIDYANLISIYYQYDQEIFKKYKKLLKDFLAADYSDQILILSLKDKAQLSNVISMYDGFIDLFQNYDFIMSAELLDTKRPQLSIVGYSNKHKSFIIIMLGLLFSLLFLSMRFVINYKKIN